MNTTTPCRLAIISADKNAGDSLLAQLRKTGLHFSVSALHWPRQKGFHTLAADLLVVFESPAVMIREVLDHTREASLSLPVLVACSEPAVLPASDYFDGGASEVIPQHDQPRLVHGIGKLLSLQHLTRHRQQLERQLATMEKRQQGLIDGNSTAIALVTADCHLYCNDAYEALFSLPLSQLGTMAPSALLASAEGRKLHSRLTDNHDTPCQITLNTSNNSAGEQTVSLVPASYRGQACWQLDYRVSAGNPHYAREKQAQSGIDLLTRLDNQQAFMNRIETAIAAAIHRGVISTLMVTRIDHFQELRETIGLVATNAVLNDITAFLKQAIDKPFTASRLAQDEFGLLLYESTPDQCLPLAEFICSKVNNCLGEDRVAPVSISTSVGMVALNDHALDAEDMITRARINTATLMKSLSGENTKEVTEAHLRQALSTHQFRVYYQPLISVRADVPGHQQARVRLSAEAGHECPAEEFLPRANVCNLAESIDRQALSAIFSAPEFHAPAGTRLLVPVSSNSLTNRTMLSWLAKKLQRQPDVAGRLLLQVSELDLHASRQSVMAFCDGLDELGVAKVISQFGCAMEPLGVVKAVAPVMVTLDDSLIRDILYSRQQPGLVRKLVNALHHQNVIVAVTGLADPDLLPALWASGIDLVAGDCLQPASTQFSEFTPPGVRLAASGW